MARQLGRVQRRGFHADKDAAACTRPEAGLRQKLEMYSRRPRQSPQESRSSGAYRSAGRQSPCLLPGRPASNSLSFAIATTPMQLFVRVGVDFSSAETRDQLLLIAGPVFSLR